ncbi:hypothetical protein [Fredinandcohnia onubensis]|uniref:hypothetical protein n=1 Tax=Fredinandcohnia onubensis TaxID=1571209 RepID=UPI000C0BC970|nr:hypothetical protein [Fredinandcohnia onubensis]
MKKKSIIGLVSLFVVCIAVVGTIAYYSLSFKSDKNIATAASFKVEATSNEQAIGNDQFDLDDELYPGMQTVEAYSFEVDKTGTEVPVEYSVKLSPSGELFPQGVESPVTFTLQRHIDGEWVALDYSAAFKPEVDKENYRILVDWPHSDNDIDFEGKSGNIHLEVIATQVDASSAQVAKEKYQAVNEEFLALDKVHNNTSFNRGNFTKTQSDAVQDSLNELASYVDGLVDGKTKTELKTKVAELQKALDEKVASRYVYYEVVEAETHFEQLALKLTAKVTAGQSSRTQNNNPLYLNSMGKGDNMQYLKYSNFSFVKPVVGDTVSFNGLRFDGGVKSIDVTFTNLGDGKWQIESDWLVEKK